jgi:hypothetical protein
MSRTIRRTRSKKNYSNFEKDYTFKRDYENHKELSGWCAIPKVKLEGREYQKAWHKFHGDTQKNYGWTEGKVYHDIAKTSYLKNDEYDIINHEEPDTSWW